MKYAEKLLQDGYVRKNKKLKDIFILAKFFKYKGLSQLQACKSILRFIKQFDNTVYSELKLGLKKRSISTVRNAYNNNYTLRHDVVIDITKEELLSIGDLKTTGEKQIMFILLVMSKFFSNGTETFYISYADVFRHSNLDYQTNNINNIIDSLIGSGCLEIINKYKIRGMVNTYCASLYERNYFKVNINAGECIAYSIDSFDNLMSEFAKGMKLVGKYYCESCNKNITLTNNKVRYCSDCAKKINIIKTMKNRKSKMFEIEK